jgi:GntR family transcriptional regulator, transcriptional repressor for pyruvate dehydrogenase complex
MNGTAYRSTLVDDTADKIRQMIFSGEIKPGELLPSRKELAEQFDVGISTIHEAVQSLSTVGLVESRPGKGTWVRHNALESVIHPSIIINRFGEIDAETIYEARLFIEMALAELAARKATPEDVEQIWAALSEAHKVIADDEDFVSADWDFHLAIAEAAHNKLLQAFYHLARELLLDFIEDAIRLPNVKEEATEYHVTQAQAIEQHDPEKARQAALDHMLYVKERLMERNNA